MLVTPGYESFKIKETWASEKDYPQWGGLKERAAYWEIATATSLLLTGAELLIMYHPRAVEVVKKMIEETFESGKRG